MSNIAVVRRLCVEDGRGLCVREWPGRADDTLVLLHGLLDSSEAWTGLCDAVGGRRVAFDLPGFGYSDCPRRGTLAGYARAVADGLDALGIERFTLVGHSFGGAVAAALAELVPHKVQALVLLAPAGFGRIDLAELIWIPGVRTLAETALPFILSSRLAVRTAYAATLGHGVKPDPALVARVTGRGGAVVDGAREATRAIVHGARARDAFHRRRLDYHGPAYALWGDRDRLVPSAHARGVRTALPQARIEISPGMGHHPMRERFDKVVALVDHARTSAAPAEAPAQWRSAA
jgi:pimeloyl-ACP methyl ester carboxylesterase